VGGRRAALRGRGRRSGRRSRAVAGDGRAPRSRGGCGRQAASGAGVSLAAAMAAVYMAWKARGREEMSHAG
jgi:hypothetical protein